MRFAPLETANSMYERSITQNRRSGRSNVLMTATIETDVGSTDVTLRNLSSEGALIEGEGIPRKGSKILFRKKELAVSGRIAWVSHRRAGIAFDARLEPETVLRHIPKPRTRIQPNFKRPGVAATDLSAEERRWCETYIWDRALPSLES